MASTTQQIPPLKQPSEELVTQTTMDDVEKAIDYQFNDKALLRSALTAAGANKDSLPNNKALARMGHSAIELVVARVGFEKGESQGKHKLRMTSMALVWPNPPHRMDESHAEIYRKQGTPYRSRKTNRYRILYQVRPIVRLRLYQSFECRDSGCAWCCIHGLRLLVQSGG